MSDGCTEGPTLAANEKPWPLGWEWEWGWNKAESDCRKPAVRIDDGHAHQWEVCHLLADGQRRVREESVVRCSTCHAPRCGDSSDPDPCMERRHHDGLHIHLSGMFRPLGDILRCHIEGCRHTASMCPDHALEGQ